MQDGGRGRVGVGVGRNKREMGGGFRGEVQEKRIR